MGTEPRYLGCTHLEVKQLGWPHHTLCAESRSAAFAFNFSAFKKNFYGCFCICTYVCTPLGAWFPWKPEWVLEWLEPEVTDSYETPCWCWESTWNLLGEHPGCCSMRSKTFFGLQEIDLHTCSICSHTEKMFFKKCLWGYGRICVANSMRLFWNEVIFMRDKM